MARSVKTSPSLKRIKVVELDLDPQNPRLVVGDRPSQSDLIQALYEKEALDELVQSFVENGYFEEEPLVVVPHGRQYRVVEGNRRLATLKLLLDSSIRRKLRVLDWPTLTSTQRRRLEVVPCIVYQTRDDVLPYLGYRHITGAKKWAPFQKARFVAQLLQAGQTLQDIQDLIGDTTQTTKKLYQDYVVFKQITDELGMSAEPIRDRFSLLEVALGQRAIKRHLGLPARLPSQATERLVPEQHLDELQEITLWVFGDGEHQSVIGDSRDIPRRLAKVVDNKEALEHLRLTGDLEGAYERTGGEEQFLLRRLAGAERALRDSAGLLALHAKNSDVKSAVERLVTLVEGLRRQIKSK